MAKLFFPGIKRQFFDVNGNPLSGGKLYSYEAGTTTFLATYTTQAGLEANTNPIILNSRGETGGIHLNADSYKFVLYDSEDNLIWTKDDVTVRDIDTEFDALSADFNTLSDTVDGLIDSASISNRLVSGAKSTLSSLARFLVPLGTSKQAKILAETTNLVYVIDDTTYTLAADTTASGLTAAPAANNTAKVNDADLADDNFTEQLGEFGSSIPIDTVGSEITSLNGKLAAFKIGGVGNEYFLARVDTTNGNLREAMRGYFYDSSGNALERTAFSDNDTITLLKLTYLYLTTTSGILATYTEPVYSASEPSAPADGDMWYDTANSKWMRFSSTAYVDSLSVFIGVCVQDDTNTIGARPADFAANFDEINTFQIEYKSATEIQSRSIYNVINVYGVGARFNDAKKVWDITADIESGQAEAASTWYYAYIKEDGSHVLSETAPYDRRGDLRGFYHSNEAWRYVCRVQNNGSSNFDISTIQNSDEQLQEGFGMKHGDTWNIGLKSATTTNAGDSILITSANHNPLSPANPGFVCLRESVGGGSTGATVVYRVEADVIILLTGAHWGNDTYGDLSNYLLRVYAINLGSSLSFGVSAIGGLSQILNVDDSVTPSDINLFDEVLVTSALTADSQASEFGWFGADFDDAGGAAENLWAVQSVFIGLSPSAYQVYPPGSTWTTNTTVLGRVRKGGDLADIIIRLDTSGIPDDAELQINLPTGLVIDTTKLASTSQEVTYLGSVVYEENGVSQKTAKAIYNNTTTFVFEFENGDGTQVYFAQTIKKATPHAWNADDKLYAKISVPIVGW